MIFKNPLVVGYKGEIGSHILQGLLKTMPKALNVWCFDIGESEKEKISRIKRSDCIFLCVPLQKTVAWLLQYKPYIKDKIIIEQCSVKRPIYTHHQLKKLKFVAMHILFRPSVTYNYSDRNCIMFIDDINKYFPNSGARFEFERIVQSKVQLLERDWEMHDALMARNQSLVHRIILILGAALKHNEGLTYIDKKILELYDRICQGDVELYKTIQDNPETQSQVKTFNHVMRNFVIERYMYNRRASPAS